MFMRMLMFMLTIAMIMFAIAVFMLATTFMVALTATAVTATTLVGKLRIDHEQRKHSRTNIIKHAYRPVPVTFRRSMG